MKKLFLLSCVVLSLFSCKKELSGARMETLTSGTKWNLRIGSSITNVYASLQQLGNEKGFYDVALVGQQPIAKPEELVDRLLYYRAISIETTQGVLERTYIELGKEKITSLQVGGALPSAVAQWPTDVPNEIAIRANDPLSTLYGKLVAIYKYPQYKDRKIALSDKPLDKPFDPYMANFKEWHFSFFSATGNPSKTGRSTVRLYFKDGKLDRIQHTYEEFDVYI